jgi:hypothetical protein
VIAVAALSGCGGGDDEEDPAAILDRAFSTPIESADVTLGAEASPEGLAELGDPIRIQASGPYREDPEDTSVSFALDATVDAFGSQIPPITLISTGEELFVEVEGTPYSLGKVEPPAAAPEDGSGLELLGLDPREWIEDAQLEEDAEVAGVPVNHVSGSVDVAALLADLNDLAAAAPEIEGQAAPTLPDDQLDQLAGAVGEASFDVFAGEEDGKLRRIALGLAFDVPEQDRSDLSGLSGGGFTLSLELANVGEDQQIPEPTGARPFSDLLEQIFAFEDLFGGSLPGVPELPDIPGLSEPGGGGERPSPGGAGRPGRGGGAQGGGAGGQPVPPSAAPEVERFQRYADCLLQANPADPRALARCDRLLGQ